jgi:hypothetical protein
MLKLVSASVVVVTYAHGNKVLSLVVVRDKAVTGEGEME